MGGLLGGLDDEGDPTWPPDIGWSFSLDVQPTREDAVGSRRDCTWILGLPGFRVVTIESERRGVESRLHDPDRAARRATLRVQWLWSTDGPGAIDAGSDVG